MLFTALLPATLNQKVLYFCHSALFSILSRAVVGTIRVVRVQQTTGSYDKCSWCTSKRSHLLDTNTSFYNNSPRTNRPMVILTRLDRVSLAASCPNSVRRCKFEGQSGRFFQRFQSTWVSLVTYTQQVQLGKHKTL